MSIWKCRACGRLNAANDAYRCAVCGGVLDYAIVGSLEPVSSASEFRSQPKEAAGASQDPRALLDALVRSVAEHTAWVARQYHPNAWPLRKQIADEVLKDFQECAADDWPGETDEYAAVLEALGVNHGA